jgi:hypothetical protein
LAARLNLVATAGNRERRRKKTCPEALRYGGHHPQWFIGLDILKGDAMSADWEDDKTRAQSRLCLP